MAAHAATRIIAHRGASGHLPEHSLAAKCLAYGMRADFLEQDLVATRDHVAVVLHDLYLDHVTNVADVFPERCRADGHFYVIDFDLAEIGRLNIVERRDPEGGGALYAGRFAFDIDGLRVVSFDDELKLVDSLNRTTGRAVGVYPEIKEPEWHLEHGVDLSSLALDALRRNGYGKHKDRVFVQTFSETEIRRLQRDLGSEFPLIRLVDQPLADGMATDARLLEDICEGIAGIGLPYESLLAGAQSGQLAPGVLYERLTETGVLIHPYTFRRDIPVRSAHEFDRLLRFFIGDLSVDALFCDHPEVAVRVRDTLPGGR